MHDETHRIVEELKAKLRPVFPYSKFRFKVITDDHIKAGLVQMKDFDQQNRKNFGYAIRGHMPIGFIGIVETPDEIITFE